MANVQKPNLKEILAAHSDSRGFLEKAAEILHTDPETACRWFRDYRLNVKRDSVYDATEKKRRDEILSAFKRYKELAKELWSGGYVHPVKWIAKRTGNPPNYVRTTLTQNNIVHGKIREEYLVFRKKQAASAKRQEEKRRTSERYTGHML